MEKIWNRRLEDLAGQYSWIADMYGVPQNPIHHAEGDVATHTQMVLDALTSLDTYRQMPVAEQQILWLSALLHDVEKRSTTFTDEKGDIVSPGHAKKGALTTRQILYTALDIPFEYREQIVFLVRHHGLPLWLMEKPNPQHSIITASFSVRLDWVHLLATADVLGRDCADKNNLLEKLEFFEAYCQEQKVWNQAYPFGNDSAKFHYCNLSQQSSPEYIPFDKPNGTVTMVCGLPGMGKDFFIEKHMKNTAVVSLDDIRRRHKIKPTDKSANGWVAQQAKEQARQYLRSKTDFVWNATCITRQMRIQLIELFSSYGAVVRIVYLEKPYRQWLTQNRERQYVVPSAALEKMLYKLEVPEKHEAHEVVHITS